MPGSLALSRLVHASASLLVRAYRSQVSARTGLACAHRAHQGGHSCSALFEERLGRGDTGAALKALGHQLKACAASNRALREGGVSRDANGRIIIPCVPFF